MDENFCVCETTAVLFDQLASVIDDNLRFFATQKKPIDSQFVGAFERINMVIEPTRVAMEELSKICVRFDVDSDTKGNGFRSLMCLIEKCLFKILEIGLYIQKSRERFFFRSYHNVMELESYSHVICRLFTMSQIALSFGALLDEDSLFADEDKYPDEVNGLVNDFDTLGRECFYGRSFGFQFSPALQQSLHVVLVALAAYGDGFNRHSGSTARALSSVIHSGKYVVDPELRAKRIVELTQHVGVPFCKAFWSLTENHGMQHVPMLICPAVAVNRQLTIPAEPMVVETINGPKMIDPPFLHSKPKIIHARLLSHSRREGQGRFGSTDSLSALGQKAHGLSKNLLFHCHGGGFVSQSSKSHEIYLRGWAKDLQCPILSIDYSLSPDAPYPEALNECFYVYNWAIKNCRTLGWTSERICLVGDSAGGNLIVALTLKLIEGDLRLPDGIVAAYPPLRVQYAPTPSRMLALMDPLLPLGILKVCLRAYAGGIHEDVLKDSISTNSLRTIEFDEFYNPFDLDLGDVVFAARRRNESILTGKKFYSDSNLARSCGYCLSRSSANFLKREELSTHGQELKASSIAVEDEIEDDVLQMHPIRSDTTMKAGPSDLGIDSAGHSATVDDVLMEPGSSATSRPIDRMEDNMFEQQGAFSSRSNTGVDRDLNLCADHELRQRATADYVDYVVKHRSKSFQTHRRSQSDSIAESFQRIRPNPSDFDTARMLWNKGGEMVCDGTQKEKFVNRNNSSARQEANLSNIKSPTRETRSTTIDYHMEYKALYIKETSDCVIIDRENLPVKFVASASTSSIQKVEKVYGRTGSTNSITSSVKRISKDPLMSPLLASDDILKKFPKLIIVACSLDPLLDDSIDFIRRMKKLKKDSEIFIVDDLPHGFLNFNFASSEAREANDLITACIKCVLKIGLKQNNSFPLSPEAMKEQTAEDAV